MIKIANMSLSLSTSRIFVTYDDRLQLLDGIKLLCLSFLKHCPNEKLHILLPEIPQNFSDWIKKQKSTNICLKEFQSSLKGWSIKPELLISFIEQGYNEVIWIDSDILIVDKINIYLDDLESTEILITNSKGIYDDRRATFWGLTPSRHFDSLLNTCFLRITSNHKELLNAWKELAVSQEFQDIQALPFNYRPNYLFGDQDLLEGLLMSENFNSVTVKLMRHCDEIIHTSSVYSLRDRIHIAIRQWKKGKMPALLHAHGIKPWMLIYRQPNRFNLTDILVELSPYIASAKPYRHDLESDTSWMDYRTWIGYLCTKISFHNPHLQAIPIIMLQKFLKWNKRLFNLKGETIVAENIILQGFERKSH